MKQKKGPGGKGLHVCGVRSWLLCAETAGFNFLYDFYQKLRVLAEQGKFLALRLPDLPKVVDEMPLRVLAQGFHAVLVSLDQPRHCVGVRDSNNI